MLAAIRMSIIEKSLKIALKAYAGQKDKAGKTYILHPLRLMNRMESDEEMAVALLHDVLEDSDITEEELLNEEIPKTVIEAVKCLTRRDSENYDDFISRVSENELASKIKVADIEDNINILRLNSLTEKDLDRVAKYHRAWNKLKSGS
jgi:(p)ppGpp synthase/HD superfamily hydrolase